MKSYFKKAFTIFLTLTMVFALSVPTFATNKHYNRGTRGFNTLYTHSVKLKNEKGYEAITVVNTGKVPINVTVGGMIGRYIGPNGGEYTWWYKSGTNTKIKILNNQYGHFSYRIKTTGYNDAIK